MRQITFTVYGRPQPAGSKRAFQNKHTGRVQVVDANAKAKPWKQEITGTAVQQMLEQRFEMFEKGVPVILRVAFHLARPAGHYGTGRNATVLKPSAPSLPVVMPDATKLLRGLEDALTGVVWHDDAQIVSQHVEKRYALGPECVVVTVCEAL